MQTIQDDLPTSHLQRPFAMGEDVDIFGGPLLCLPQGHNQKIPSFAVRLVLPPEWGPSL